MAPISDAWFSVPDPSTARAENNLRSHPLWVEGEFMLRVREGDSEHIHRVRRPFALLGRIPGSDICIEDRAISARHVYLHLDDRGVFGVDLATRTGTRFGKAGHSSGWLMPGQAFEVAGRRVELLEAVVSGVKLQVDHEVQPPDPLADTGAVPLIGATLHALHARHTPRALCSELVFVGRGASCGVRVEGATASRVHCVLVRTPAAAFVVDLIGRGTWLNGRLVTNAAALGDGDTLVIGSARFGVRLTRNTELVPAEQSQALLPQRAQIPGWLAPPDDGPFGVAPLPAGAPPLPSTLPPETQGAILAWMMGALQAGQAEALRRQSEFHLALTRLIQQMQRDQASLLTEHLDRMERIDRELAELRGEIYRRFGSAEAANSAALPVTATRAVDPEAGVPPGFRVETAPKPPDSDPAATAAWLVNRVSQLEEEQRSGWKDMISRLTGRTR